MNAFSAAAPIYEARLNDQLESLWVIAASYDIPIDANQLRQTLNTSGVFTLLSNLLTALGALPDQRFSHSVDCCLHFNGSSIDATESPCRVRARGT